MPSLQLHTDKRKGRCVCASSFIKKGSIIEVAPVKPLKKQLTWADPLFDYTFEWLDKPFVEAVAFGMVSMVNHSTHPNASIQCNLKEQTITLRAIQDIRPGVELGINYDTRLWFQAEAG